MAIYGADKHTKVHAGLQVPSRYLSPISESRLVLLTSSSQASFAQVSPSPYNPTILGYTLRLS